ncbi:MAG: hypothetical protein JSW25_10465 [Thermoplasmata archaeon]|nr:MAG: hypothetical protein JSW25_10465 [Thermoplasmata archaeon]
MALMDDVVMLALAIAVAAAVLVGLMLVLYAWALRRQRRLEELDATEEKPEYPPDGKFQL